MTGEKLIGVVAAQPNFFVVSLVHGPGSNDVNPSLTPIVAWRIIQTGDETVAIPVTVESLVPPWAIRGPDGRVIDPDNAEYDNVDAWLAEKRREQQKKKI